MKNVKWQMKENFTFLPEIGLPASADQLKVTPRFTSEQVEGRPKLTGIYHLAVNVNLEERKNNESEVNEAILIDDLEIDGETGYFEYAVPFNIDFPPEADDPIDIKVLNPTHEVDKNGCLSIIWDVECSYTEVGIHQIQQEEQKENSSVKAANSKKKKKETASNENQSAGGTKNEKADTEELTAHQSEAETTVESEPVSNSSQVVVENSSFTDGDEVLSFISELEDGITTTGFRLNDVLVQGKS